MDLLNLWREKYERGKISFDADLLVMHPVSAGKNYDWGTVFYSHAREIYKTEVKKRKTSFDPDLMSELELAEFGNLIVAANPNSLFEGHLVIYPKEKSPELTYDDLYDLTRLAQTHPEQTFIHNMERAAASIVDWAHYQAYSMVFPIEKEAHELLGEFGPVKVARISEDSPAYMLAAESSESGVIARWLMNILELLAGSNPHGRRIPCNFIWRKSRVWIVPRAFEQSELAASYFGGLEMGGIFCLPNADELRRYLPGALRKEITQASLASEPDTQKWFEENALRALHLCLRK
jgi:hypothetical protein